MRTFGNIIWHFPFLGFLQSLVYAIGGLFWCITIIGIPLGLGLFQLSLFTLAPFSRRLVTVKDLELVTGEKQNSVVKGWFFIIRILYFPMGLFLAIANVFLIALEFLSIIGIPCGIVWSKALSTIFNPINKKCVSIALAEEIDRRKANKTLEKYNTQTPPQNQTIIAQERSIDDKRNYASMNDKALCPQCNREISKEWEHCPYCGCNIKEVLNKREKEDNSRFVPSGYSNTVKAEKSIITEKTENVVEKQNMGISESAGSEVNRHLNSGQAESYGNNNESKAIKINSSLIVIIICIVVLIASVSAYFIWYVPYAKDRDALRTYVVADNIFLRSSKVLAVEYNILTKIGYGTELITYSKDSEWAEIKTGDIKGFVASQYIVDGNDFSLLNNIWGSYDTKEYIESAKCRLALIDFCKKNKLITGTNSWQLFTIQKGVKPNNVSFPRLNNGYDKFTEFAFILKNNSSLERRTAIYSFDENTEMPILVYQEKAPWNGEINDVRYRNNRYIVNYTEQYSSRSKKTQIIREEPKVKKEIVVEKEEEPVNPDLVYEQVDQMPEYPGGMEELNKFIYQNIKYPSYCKKNRIEGKVLVSFIIDKDGTPINFRVVETPEPLLSGEAIRVVRMMPKWKPGKLRGVVVKVAYTLPIDFKL